MDELDLLIGRAADGDLNAFERLVARFQNMAFGCAFAVLGDFGLAQDVVQEAFVEVYQRLPGLRHPGAFPGWLRKKVLKHCDRITRRMRPRTVPIEEAANVPSAAPEPDEVAERKELNEAVLDAIRRLPEGQRMAATLFYINDCRQGEVAEFLEVPVTAVQKRLHDARKNLKERMLTMVGEVLKSHALPEEFSTSVGARCAVETASPSLVRFREKWILVWQDGEPHPPYDGPFWFWLAESADGREWSEPRRLPIESGWQAQPVLCVHGDSLVLHTHNHVHGLKIALSRDLDTWEERPVLVLGDVGRSGVFSSGDRLYLIYPLWQSKETVGDSVQLLMSRDDGESWSWLTPPCAPRGGERGICDAAGICVSGQTYIVWRDHEYSDRPFHDVWVTHGEGIGESWAGPVKVKALSTQDGSLRLVLEAFLNEGLCIAQDVRRENNTSEVWMAVSKDGGATWSEKKVYASRPLIDPAISVAEDGKLLLAGSATGRGTARTWVVHSRLA